MMDGRGRDGEACKKMYYFLEHLRIAWRLFRPVRNVPSRMLLLTRLLEL
jgi:hypothetical protein